MTTFQTKTNKTERAKILKTAKKFFKKNDFQSCKIFVRFIIFVLHEMYEMKKSAKVQNLAAARSRNNNRRLQYAILL